MQLRSLVTGLLSTALAVPLVAATTAPAAARSVEERPIPSVAFNGAVDAIAVNGSTVYVAGRFTQARQGSHTFVRRHVAAVDARTGRLLPWKVPVNGPVRAVEHAGGKVYLGGAFTKVGARSVAGVARVSARTGGVDKAFRPRVGGTVHAIAVARRRVFLGGEFSSVAGTHRTRLAAVSRDRGALQAWKPRANNTVTTLKLRDGLLYAGGLFSAINGDTDHGYLVALSRTTGRLATSFHAAIGYPALDVTFTDRRVLVAGGGKGGKLAALDRAGRHIWSSTFDGDVVDVEVLDGLVYVGGHWEYICSSRRVAEQGGDCLDEQVFRPRLASFTMSGRRTRWAPHPDSVEGVLAVAAAARRLVVGGSFDHFADGAVTRRKLAIFRLEG